MIPTWVKLLVGGISAVVFMSRGGFAMLGPAIKFIIPAAVFYLVAKKLKTTLISASSQKKSMPRGSGEQYSSNRDEASQTIEICPQCGRQIELGHEDSCLGKKN